MTESSPVVLIEPIEDVRIGAAGCVVPNTKGKVSIKTLHTKIEKTKRNSKH